jgi:hypothetical protein
MKDKIIEIDTGGAAFAAHAAGQAFPDRVFDVRFIIPLNDYFVGQKPGRVFLSGKPSRARCCAFAAFQTLVKRHLHNH